MTPYEPPQADISKQACQNPDCRQNFKDMLGAIVILALLVGVFVASTVFFVVKSDKLVKVIEAHGWMSIP